MSHVLRGRCEPSTQLLERDLDLGRRAGQGYTATHGGWVGELLTAVVLLSVNVRRRGHGHTRGT